MVDAPRAACTGDACNARRTKRKGRRLAPLRLRGKPAARYSAMPIGFLLMIFVTIEQLIDLLCGQPAEAK